MGRTSKKRNFRKGWIRACKKNYERAGEKLEGYKEKLKDATDSLEKMKASSETSSEELEEQEKAVKELEKRVVSGSSAFINARKSASDMPRK